MNDHTVKIRITRHIDTAPNGDTPGGVFYAGEYFVTETEASELRDKPGVSFPDEAPIESTPDESTPATAKKSSKAKAGVAALPAPEATVTRPSVTEPAPSA